MLPSFFQSRSPRRTTKLKSSRNRGTAYRFRPRLEVLEVREVPSTFAVQVFDDGVPVTGTTTSTGPNSLAFLGSSAHFSAHIVLGTTLSLIHI